MSQVIVITSGKGGVGKTTVTANIGAALADLGKHVIMVDADVGLRNLDSAVGKESMVVFDFLDFAQAKCTLEQAALKDEKRNGLYMLPAPQMGDNISVTPEMMLKLCKELKKNFDYILIDCPAGIEQGFKNAIAPADYAIIVTTPDQAAMRDADRVAGLLEKSDLEQNYLIINRIRVDMIKKGDMLNIKDVIEILGIDTLGLIPEDSRVIASTAHGTPVVNDKRSIAAQSFKNIARRICGERVPVIDFMKKKKWKRGY